MIVPEAFVIEFVTKGGCLRVPCRVSEFFLGRFSVSKSLCNFDRGKTRRPKEELGKMPTPTAQVEPPLSAAGLPFQELQHRNRVAALQPLLLGHVRPSPGRGPGPSNP